MKFLLKLFKKKRCIAPSSVDLYGIHQNGKWIICDCDKHKAMREKIKCLLK